MNIMQNITFKGHHDKGVSILLKVDGNDVKCINNGTFSTAALTLEKGNHEITIVKNTFLCKWYWWLNIFNIVYVLLLLKNRTGGRVGYDDNYASCTLNVFASDKETAELDVDLLKKEYNKNGKQGSYFSWGDIKAKNVKLKDMRKNEMPKPLIRRWRIAHGLPTAFYCTLACIALVICIIIKEIQFDFSIAFCFLILAIYSAYILISTFNEKSVEDNLIKSEK